MDTRTDLGTWFEAASRYGPLRLCTGAVCGVARHAADAALALHRCEELLGALDRWTGLELDWRWAPSPPARMVSGSDARAWWRPGAGVQVTDSTSQDPECLIAWPWGLLRALPAPGDVLVRQLQWLTVPVVLTISRLRIGADELGLLEPGGALVLPQSLLPPWHGVLRGDGEPAGAGCGVPVALASPWKPVLVNTRAPADDSDDSDDDTLFDAGLGTAQTIAGERCLCEVRLATPHALAGDRLTGWFESELSEVGPHATLWRCASARAPALCLAIGRLMPWGDGWALGLESLCEETVPFIAQMV
jgi:hypothetical protein